MTRRFFSRLAGAAVIAVAGCSPPPAPSSAIGFSGPESVSDGTAAAAQVQAPPRATAEAPPRATANVGASPSPSPSVPSVPSAVPPAPTAEPKAQADGRVVIAADFPAGTRSLRVTEVAHVKGAPSDRARYIGKITFGTRVAWTRIVAPDKDDSHRRRHGHPCAAWVEIVPRGFLCEALLRPSPEPPLGIHQPVVKKGRLTPDDYFKVMANETKAYKSSDDVQASLVDKVLSTKVMVTGKGIVHIGETPYVKTDQGIIEASALGKFWPSNFQGLELEGSPPRAWPFAWVFFERGARKPRVYGEPSAKGAPVRAASRREIVPILEERNGFVRIADAEWIEGKHLRIAKLAPPPPGLAPNAQWIDVDLDDQVLVAYEGATPIFATLVSTGGRRHPTPPATYRVRAKAAITPMDGDPKIPNRYEVAGVPWAVRLGLGLYLHGVYWHDGFGGARSHGCVNLSPKDAAFLYEWIEPKVPDGWSEVEVPSGEGARVRIHDREHPDPPAFDYTKEEPWAVK